VANEPPFDSDDIALREAARQAAVELQGAINRAEHAAAVGRLVRAIARHYPDALAANGYWHDGWRKP
jgi:hypothetical protein